MPCQLDQGIDWGNNLWWHAPGHNACDPLLAPQQVGVKPFGDPDVLKEMAIDSACAESSSGAKKKGGEHDGWCVRIEVGATVYVHVI